MVGFYCLTCCGKVDPPSGKGLLNKRVIAFLATLWMLGVGFLVMTVFQSLLVSKLTLQKSRPLVDTMKDFLTNTRLKGIAPLEIHLEDALHRSGIPVYEKAFLRIKRNVIPARAALHDTMIRRVEEGSVCLFHGHLILEGVMSDFFRKYGACQLHLSEKYFFPFPLILPLRRSVSPLFYEKFNKQITHLVDADIPGKWLKPAYQVSKLCITYVDKDLKAISLKHIYGVLIVWAIGISLGTLTLALEILYESVRIKEEYSGRRLM